MTGPTDHPTPLERAARTLHAQAVAHVPAHTLARLRPRPAQAATARRGWQVRPLGWSLATACAVVLVAVLGVRNLAAPDVDGLHAPAQELTAPAAPAQPLPDLLDDPLMAFDEDPDLYLWLASAEARPLAME